LAQVSSRTKPKKELITAIDVRAGKEFLIVVLPNEEVRIRWEDCSPVLQSAGEVERSYLRLAPGGYGIHWPLIDEDLTVGGLVRTARRSTS
jgi:hypothetical protein